MYRRLFLVFLPSLTAAIDSASANDSAWNCHQSKDGKEWVCVGKDATPEQTTDTKQPVKTEPVKQAQPIPDEAVQPIVAEPAVKERPQPQPIKQPVVVKPTEKIVEQAEPEELIAEPVPTVPKSIDAADAKAIEPKAEPTPQRDLKESEPLEKPSIAAAKKVLPKGESNRPGWACGATGENKNWDCKLVGADPKGEPAAVKAAASSSNLGWLDPAFSHQQEQVFSTLTSQLPVDPWQNCMATRTVAPSSYQPRKDLRESSPLDVKSDYGEIFDNEISSYYGNVEMTRADQRSLSKAANYDSVSDTLDLQGNVYYSEDELALYSETATLKLASDQARLRDVMFIAPSAPLRGRADAVYRESKTLSRYKEVAYTSCQPGNQDWVVHASELKINKTSGMGSAKNAWIEFKGAPVFYSPYLSFPTDSRRLSGFLAPSFGSTQRSGFNASIPYYWNIAPNYDATFKPRYLSKRGIVLGGIGRYLTEMSSGITSLEYMPDDSIRNKARYLASVKNITQFTPNISSNLDLNYVSDKDYFAELGNALSIPNFSYMRSQADIGYRSEPASLVARVENYQSIDKAITKESVPYRKLPQVNLNLNHSFDSMPVNTALGSEYVWFQHDYRVNGQRMDVKPTVSFPMQNASAFLIPKLSLEHTEYILGNQQAPGPVTGTTNAQYLLNDGVNYGTRTSDSISRTLPILSADSGLYLERDLDIGDSTYLNTVEPRLFYLYTPRVNQQDIPIFDTALYDFGYNSLFRENRFSGSDRIQDANQVTAAVSTRLVDTATGRERLKLSVGEIFYFSDRQVILPGYLEETNSLSNVVADLNSQLSEHFSVESGMQWNPDTSKADRHRVILHYKNEPGAIFNVGYRIRENTLNPNAVNNLSFPQFNSQTSNAIRQTDMSFHWPIVDNWFAVGRWQYSMLYNSTQESFLGVEKENCCWKFSVIGRRYINNANVYSSAINPQGDVQGVSQTGVFFQIELKGLTGIGEKLDQFFEQNISGYRKSEK